MYAFVQCLYYVKNFQQDQDFSLHAFNPLHNQLSSGAPFTMPPTSVNNGTGGQQPQNLSQPSQQNGFSFTPPNAPHAKDGKQAPL